MHWENHEEVPKKREVIDLAHGFVEADVPRTWVSSKRNESVVQTGFACPLYEGKPKRLFSLAGTIADMHEQPWLGKFNVSDDVWWLVAIRDGHAVLPDGDMVGTRQEIDEKYEELSGMATWNHVSGEYEDVKKLVQQAKPGPSKIWLAEEKSVGKPLIGAFALMAVAGAAGAYFYHQNQLEEQRQRALKVLAAAKNKEALKPQVDAAYLSTPEPMVWLAACKEKLASLPLVEKGWDLAQVECGTSALSFQRKRTGFATIGYRPAGALINDNETNSVLQLALPKPRGNMDLPPLNQGREELLAWAQKTGVTVVIEKAASNAPGPDGNPAQQVIPRRIGFSFVMPSTPMDVSFAEQIGKIEGLRLVGIVRKVSDSSSEGWAVKGSVYGS